MKALNPMTTACIPSTLALSILILSTLALTRPADARPVRMWSPDELTRKADLIVIATAQSTRDASPMDTTKATADTWVPVQSVFGVQAVLKGHLSGRTVTVEHYRYFDPSAEVSVVDGPEFVRFAPVRKTPYLIYLKARPGDTYEPLSGQEDPWLSFSQIQPYDAGREGRPGPVSPGPARLPAPRASTAAADSLAKARTQIQAAYDAGEHRVGILQYPTAWSVDSHSLRYTRRVRAVTLTGILGHVTVYQDDSLAAVDPKTGARHVIRATATYSDTWKRTPRGWFFKKSAPEGGSYTIDGAVPTVMN